jgi:hypothetical protein
MPFARQGASWNPGDGFQNFRDMFWNFQNMSLAFGGKSNRIPLKKADGKSLKLQKFPSSTLAAGCPETRFGAPP